MLFRSPILTLIGLVVGNALYSGWSQPKLPIERAKLALELSVNPDSIPITFNPLNVFRAYSHQDNSAGSSVSAKNIIKNCLEALSLQKQGKTLNSSHFGSRNNKYEFINSQFSLLLVKPGNLIVRFNEISGEFYVKIIADEQELLQIIENLDIQVNINEK